MEQVFKAKGLVIWDFDKDKEMEISIGTYHGDELGVYISKDEVKQLIEILTKCVKDSE